MTKRHFNPLTAIDSFGTHIKLLTKGQEKHQTSVGGILTLVSAIGILIYGIFLVIDVYDKQNKQANAWSFNSETFSYQKTNQIRPHYDVKIIEAFGMQNGMIDPSIASLQANWIQQSTTYDNGTNTLIRQITSKSIPLIPCNNNFAKPQQKADNTTTAYNTSSIRNISATWNKLFNNETRQTATFLGGVYDQNLMDTRQGVVNNLMCPDLTKLLQNETSDVVLSGNYDSVSFQYLQYSLMPCDPVKGSIVCQPTSVITSYFYNNPIAFLWVEQYTDALTNTAATSDYTMKQKLERVSQFVNVNEEKIVKLKLQANELIIQSGIRRNLETKSYYGELHLDLQDNQPRLNSSQPFITFQIELENEWTIAEVNSQRKIDYVMILSAIGGMWTTVQTLVGILIASYVQMHYVHYLRDKMYIVKKNKNKSDNHNQVQNQIQEQNAYQKLSENIKAGRIDQDDIKSIVNSIATDRTHFASQEKNHQLSFFFKTFRRVFSCCSKDRRYNQSINKLNRDLDIVNMLISMQESKLVSQAMLTNHQKLMLKFQRHNLIDGEQVDTDHETDNLTNQILDERKTTAVGKVQAVKVVETELMNFCQVKKLSQLDKNLLKGFYKNVQDDDVFYLQRPNTGLNSDYSELAMVKQNTNIQNL